MKNILLCLNQLGIGGVETAVLNYTIKLIQNGYKVIILAKDGIYRKKYEEYGAIFEEIDFKVENKYDLEKIEKVIKIIEKYNINQVHIHQFDCINSVFPACIIKNIPYIAYAHTGITGTYDWFENSYPGYKEMFKIYFECAEKIIPITNQAKEEIQNKYNILDEEKYLIIKNSINFEEEVITKSKSPDKINNFLIISRLNSEKEISIKNAIELFKKYYERNKDARLTIVGDGLIKDKIKEYTTEIKKVTTFLGQRNDVLEIISKHDVIIGLDRCILETIAMKKIAIVSGYKEMKNLVTPEIIQKLSESNFSGENIKIASIQEIVEKLEKLTKEEIKKIVEENYKYIYINLNISNNVKFIDNIKKTNVEINPKIMLQIIMDIQNNYSKEIEEKNELWKEYEKTNEIIRNKEIEIDKKEERIQNLEKEINKVYNSKTWKITDKIGKLIKGKKYQ